MGLYSKILLKWAFLDFLKNLGNDLKLDKDKPQVSIYS